MSRLRHPFGHQPPKEWEDSKVFFFQTHASVLMRWIGLSPVAEDNALFVDHAGVNF